jgi:hypothetical protein
MIMTIPGKIIISGRVSMPNPRKKPEKKNLRFEDDLRPFIKNKSEHESNNDASGCAKSYRA